MQKQFENYMEVKFEINAIRSNAQYSKYLSKVDALMDTDPTASSANGQLLETLTILIEDYEKKQGWEILKLLSRLMLLKIEWRHSV